MFSKPPCITTQQMTHHDLCPLQQKEKIRIAVCHEENLALQLEFYFPVKVWNHRATVNFLKKLNTLNPGATIFISATGVWGQEV